MISKLNTVFSDMTNLGLYLHHQFVVVCECCPPVVYIQFGASSTSAM